MMKFLKYELKGSYKMVLGIVLILCLGSTLISATIFATQNPGLVEIIKIAGILSIVGSGLIMVGFIGLFAYLINSFKRELYEDGGYLTHMLPLSGYQIVGAKIIGSIVSIVTVLILWILYSTLLQFIIFAEAREAFMGALQALKIDVLAQQLIPRLIVISIGGIVVYLMSLVTMYLSMTISKIGFKKQNLGGYWFIIFVVLNIMISGILQTLQSRINANIDMGEVVSQIPMQSGSIDMTIINSGMNITWIVGSLIIGVILFIATGYLFEKKVDL